MGRAGAGGVARDHNPGGRAGSVVLDASGCRATGGCFRIVRLWIRLCRKRHNRAPEFKGSSNKTKKFVQFMRFTDITTGVEFVCRADLLGVIRAGHDDNRNRCKFRIGFELGQHLQTRFFWQMKIKKNDVRKWMIRILFFSPQKSESFITVLHSVNACGHSGLVKSFLGQAS